ncbi:replication-relaxation family protein [Terrihalobacillus insolitus]|uniref:replication-relaxation family protein n=1 Tax=Terrihalobacillus insolitus TaxID=2950438 RepID=UPI002340A5E4|nr:replication-relaxation family protein [Terrihalobacillus insolitus]MDC3412501.1 replication-relaxation family protein [Terrihalobacillus insolitus]
MATIKFATRSQLQEICKLGGDRNANRILQRLEHENLISSFRWHQKIYSISKSGRQLIGNDTIPVKRNAYVQHTLMCNEAYIDNGTPNDWRTEEPVKFKSKGVKKRFVPDATFTKDGRTVFVEVDRTQRMNENRKKLEIYSELQNEYKIRKKCPPFIIFYTTTIMRKRKMELMCKEMDLLCDIYLHDEIKL